MSAKLRVGSLAIGPGSQAFFVYFAFVMFSEVRGNEYPSDASVVYRLTCAT